MEGSNARPIKLRAACNQCHMSKVRCSGEKTGCVRCSTLGYSCAYSESRVGKVQGSRARRRLTESGSEQVQAPSPSPSPLAQTATTMGSQQQQDEAPRGRTRKNSSRSTADPADVDSTALELDDSLSVGLNEHGLRGNPKDVEMHNSNDCSLFVGFEDELPYMGTPLIDPAMLSPSALRGDIIDHRLGLPCPPNPPGDFLPNPSTPSPHGTAGRPGPDDCFDIDRPVGPSQRMMDCLGLVNTLEYHIQTQLVASDKVMCVNKHCIVSVLDVIEFEGTSPSMSLLGLCCLALNHVLTLFEGSLNQLFLPEKRSDERVPTIQFGNFSVDPEEYLVIHSQIFRRELQRFGHATDKLADRLPRVHEDRGCLGNIYSSWLAYMQKRLQTLHGTIGK